MRPPTSTTTTGTVDDSVFNDKELIAVDNNPGSPHYGRIYVTYTKFHLQPNGFSDYCPLQLSYTDSIPTENPVLSTWSHTAIQPDNPGGDGTGASANQFSVPVVEKNGTLDVGFVSENCNDSFDPHLLFQRSTDGGQTFLPSAVQIDKPGQYADFMTGRAPTPSRPRTSARRTPRRWPTARRPARLLYVYQNNINRPDLRGGHLVPDLDRRRDCTGRTRSSSRPRRPDSLPTTTSSSRGPRRMRRGGST